MSPKKFMQNKTQGVGGDVPSAWTRKEKTNLETDWNRLKKVYISIYHFVAYKQSWVLSFDILEADNTKFRDFVLE